jgi:hypothetical protein
MRKFIQQPSNLLRSAIALALAVSVLIAGWMAVSPELHGWLHHDAGDEHHECIVTMIAAGGVDHVVIAPIIMTAPVGDTTALKTMHSEWVQPLFLDGGVLVHGPPALS